MAYVVMLVPLGLLALVLGLERLERWTFRDGEDRPATPPAPQ
jgi:hypothetical protein